MADDVLGTLAVAITGDYSDLTTAISSAQSTAQTGADQIQAAFDRPDLAAGMTGSLASLSTALQGTSTEVQTFGSQTVTAMTEVSDSIASVDSSTLPQLSSDLSDVATSATTVTPAAQEAGDAIQHTGDSAQEAEGGLASIVEQLTLLGEALVVTDGLKEFGQEALTAAGTVQSVTIGITALTGSAQKADEIVSQIKELAATEPFAFPEIAPTVQKMVALGVSAEQIPTVMQAAADASAATGNSFQAVANMIDRMTLSGQVNARGMATLGISLNQLGDAMGVTAEQAKNAFKELDQSERINVVTEALQKFAGTSEAEAQGITGQWQIFKNQFEEVMVGVGSALKPVMSDILGFGKVVLEALQGATQAFSDLPKPVQDVAVAVGILVAAVVPLTAGLAALGLGIQGLSTLPAVFTALTTAITGTSAAETTLTASAATATTAVEAEGTSAVKTAAEVTTLGGAATSLTGVLGALGAAAGVVGAVFTGWVLGDMAARVKDTDQQLTDLTKTAHSLGISLSSLTDATGNTTQAVNQAQKAAQNAGVDFANLKKQFDDGDISAKQYVLDLIQLITDHHGAAKAAGDHEQATNQVVLAVQHAEQAVTKARDALADIETHYRSASNYAQLHAAAVAEVDKAEKSLGAVLGETTAKLKDFGFEMATVPTQAESVQAAIDKINAKVLVETSTLQNAIDVWAKMASDSTESAAAVADALKTVESYAKSLGVSQDDLKAKMDAARASQEGFTEVLVNGHATWVQSADDANALAAAHQEVGDQALTASDSVTILKGSVGQLDDGYQALNSDSPGVVIGMQQISDAAQQAATSIDDATQALDDFNQAGDQVGGGKGGGGASGGLNSIGMTLDAYLQAGATGSMVDQLASALGLIKVGNNSYDTLAQYNDVLKATATAGNKNAPYEQLVSNGSGGFTIQWENLNTQVTHASTTTSKLSHSATAASASLSGTSSGNLTTSATAAAVASTTAATALDTITTTSGTVQTALDALGSAVGNAAAGMQLIGDATGSSTAAIGAALTGAVQQINSAVAGIVKGSPSAPAIPPVVSSPGAPAPPAGTTPSGNIYSYTPSTGPTVTQYTTYSTSAAAAPGGGTSVYVSMAGANFSGADVANQVANALTNTLRTTMGQLRLV